MDDGLTTLFANNLRLQAAKYPSIAHICRGVPINRQQFNKYLLGRNLPSAKVRHKLCQFFGIPEDEMFSVPIDGHLGALPKMTQAEVSQADRDAFANQMINALIPQLAHAQPNGLRSGYYFCYFPLQNFANYLVRSLVKVSHNVVGGTFVRHTYFRSTNAPHRVVCRGRHKGIVFATDKEITLLAFTRTLPHHLSMLVFERNSEIDPGVLFGLSLTRGTKNFFASNACLEFIGTKFSAVRRKRGLVGVFDRKDASVPLVVQIAMAQPSPRDGHQLHTLDYENLVVAQGAKQEEVFQPEFIHAI